MLRAGDGARKGTGSVELGRATAAAVAATSTASTVVASSLRPCGFDTLPPSRRIPAGWITQTRSSSHS